MRHHFSQLSFNLPVVNLVAPYFDRFHLPSDAEGSVNVSALDALTSSVAMALERYMCDAARTCDLGGVQA